MPLKKALRLALLVSVGGIYLGLGYLASSSQHPSLLAVLATTIPVLVGFIAACWQTPFRLPVIGLCLASMIAMAQHIDLLLSHVAWFYFLQHIGAMLALGIMFGITLRTRKGALCSRIAQVTIVTPLDDQYLHYTWKVTLAWTIYFGASAIISTGLFFAASLEIWSLFATVLSPISIGVMFGCEYLIRLRALPGRPHFSVAQTIECYQKYVKRRGCTE
jgi:uncharacterized membrane protein